MNARLLPRQEMRSRMKTPHQMRRRSSISVHVVYESSVSLVLMTICPTYRMLHPIRVRRCSCKS
jgi:hypothetical protein